jgi:hypothetical protein
MPYKLWILLGCEPFIFGTCCPLLTATPLILIECEFCLVLCGSYCPLLTANPPLILVGGEFCFILYSSYCPLLTATPSFNSGRM